MRRLAAILLGAAIGVIGLSTVQPVSALLDAPIVIEEVQAGTSNYRHEMLAVRNRTDAAINLDQHKVIISDSSGAEVAAIPLTGELAAYGVLFLLSEPYVEYLEEAQKLELDYMAFQVEGDNALSSGGGHVALVNDSSEIDRLGYGDAQHPETAAAPYLPGSQALKRCSDAQGMSVDTNDNSRDFVLNDTPMDVQPGPLCEQLEEPSAPTCTGIILSEILPNAAGTDGGNEFIEIYNPTEEEMTLEGCSLKLGSEQYEFPTDEVLAAGAYRTLSDSKTGLTLPNTAGGEVWLVTTTTEEIVQYPGGLKEGTSWALVGGKWQQTHLPTPGAANQLKVAPQDERGGKGGGLKPCPTGKYRHSETNRCRNKESASGLKPCREGQERNPATNRCRSTASAANSLAPCKPGQSRNPATNRCRSTTSTASTLKPCKADQFRNPETNRCKKKESSESLVPCKAGWERNPETNRCRKKRDSAEPAYAVQETPPTAGSQVGWWAAGAMGAGAVGYGAFQWRQEIMGTLRKLKPSGAGSSPPEL